MSSGAQYITEIVLAHEGQVAENCHEITMHDKKIKYIFGKCFTLENFVAELHTFLFTIAQ